MSCTSKIAKLWPYAGTCIGSTIKLPYTGLANGAYRVELKFLNSNRVFTINAVAGELTLPTDSLNEEFYYEGKVYNSVGQVVLFNVDYDAFSFETKFIKNVE